MLKENAPGPDAMFKEMVRIGEQGLKNNTSTANIVQEMLAAQMRFYAELTEPEVTGDAEKVMLAVQGLAGHVEAVLICGSEVIHYMNTASQTRWRTNAAALRQDVTNILGLLV